MSRATIPGSLAGRVAVVTGGSGGIGRAISTDLARRGAAVAITYRRQEDTATKVAEEIAGFGGTAVAVRVDIADHDQVTTMIDRVLETLGGIHIVVNNAGVGHDALIFDMTPDIWLDVMRVNFGGVVNCTRAAVEHFMAQRNGVIVNISSPLADRAWVGTAAYAASKAAVNAFTRNCAAEFGRFGVRVNAVAPGLVATDLTSAVTAKKGEAMGSRLPLRRSATPEDIARVVAFLAGDDSSYMTGAVVVVDGGGSSVMGSGAP